MVAVVALWQAMLQPAPAQTGAQGAYNFRFAVVAMAPEKADMGSLERGANLDIEGVSYETGGVVRSLGTIPFQARSKSYLYRGSQALSFFRVESNEKGEPVRRVLAEVAPKPNWRSVLIVAYPEGQGAADGFRAEVIPDDSRAFPANSIYLANHSRVEVALVLDGQRHAIKPGGDLLLPVSLSQARMLPMQFFVAGQQASKPVYSTSLPFRPGQRLLALLQGSARSPLRVPPVILFDVPGQTVNDSFDPAKTARP